MTDGGDWKNMFAAALEGDLGLVDFHLDHGIDVDFQHPEYMSSVLVASICAGQEDVAHHLLDRGADPLLRSDFEEMTPVQAASLHGMAPLVDRLVAAGAPAPGAQPLETRSGHRFRALVRLLRPWAT